MKIDKCPGLLTHQSLLVNHLGPSILEQPVVVPIGLYKRTLGPPGLELIYDSLSSKVFAPGGQAKIEPLLLHEKMH